LDHSAVIPVPPTHATQENNGTCAFENVGTVLTSPFASLASTPATVPFICTNDVGHVVTSAATLANLFATLANVTVTSQFLPPPLIVETGESNMTGILSTSSLGFSNGSSLNCTLANNNCEFLREAHATLPVVMGPNVSSNHNHDATIPAASKKKSCHSATHQISTTTHDSGHDSGIDNFLGCTNDLTVALPLGQRHLVLNFPGPP